jgi:hypothetical protein
MPEIIGTNENPGLKIERFMIIKLCGVNYKLYKYYLHHANIKKIKYNTTRKNLLMCSLLGFC